MEGYELGQEGPKSEETLPTSASDAKEWLLKGQYCNSGHQTQIEAIAGKSIDEVRAEQGLVDDSDPQPENLTTEQQAAEDRICAALAKKKPPNQFPETKGRIDTDPKVLKTISQTIPLHLRPKCKEVSSDVLPPHQADEDAKSSGLSSLGSVEQTPRSAPSGDRMSPARVCSANSHASQAARDLTKRKHSASNVFTGEECFKVFVTGLAAQTTCEDLTHALKAIFMGIEKVTIAMKNGKSRRFGFVSVDSKEAMEELIKHDQLLEMHGRKLTLRQAMSDEALQEQKEHKAKERQEQKEQKAKERGEKKRPRSRSPKPQRYATGNRGYRQRNYGQRQRSTATTTAATGWPQTAPIQGMQQNAPYPHYWLDPMAMQQMQNYYYYGAMPASNATATASAAANPMMSNPYYSAFAQSSMPFSQRIATPAQAGPMYGQQVATYAVSSYHLVNKTPKANRSLQKSASAAVNTTPSNAVVAPQNQCPWKTKISPA